LFVLFLFRYQLHIAIFTFTLSQPRNHKIEWSYRSTMPMENITTTPIHKKNTKIRIVLADW
jgi:hypothetical protein